MTDKEFIEAIYELAFGHDAINRNFGHAEVIEQIEDLMKILSSGIAYLMTIKKSGRCFLQLRTNR